MSTPIDKSGRRIRTMFGEIAPRYDLLNHLLSGGVDYYWRAVAVRTVPPQGLAPILDVCTGTGDLAFAYWKRGRGAVTVVGSDFTREMLRRACRKRTRRHAAPGAAPLVFVEADTLALPFADGQFQIVSVAFGLRNVSDTLQGLREMTRVCQPGGRVAVLEFSLPQTRWFRRLYLAYFRTILPRLGQLVSGNRQLAYKYLPESVAEFPQGRELATMMESAGLTQVQFRPLTLGIATLYWGVRPALPPMPPCPSSPVPT